MTKRGASLACLTAVMLLGAIATSAAAQITIVALGTSNTIGRGLPLQESYPTQLQAMLRSKGYDVQIINMGVNGDTSAGLLARVDAVPNETRLVLVEYSPRNESRGGITNTGANMAAIRSRLAARNIKCIDLTAVIQGEHRAAASSGNLISTPAGPHLNAVAYGHVAAQALPWVEAEIGP